ncbi:MAG TPA: hypothetical protein VM577_16810 [Anaerovoracaceae bacterium]|nr:hypothetical protein [Anaerovoracaceae bacterium]
MFSNKYYAGSEGWSRFMAELDFLAAKNPQPVVKNAPAYTAYFPEVQPDALFTESEKVELAQFGINKPFHALEMEQFNIKELKDCTPMHVLTASEMTLFAHELHKTANHKHEIPAYVMADIDLSRKNAAKYASYDPATADTPFIVTATIEREQYLKECNIPDEKELARFKSPMDLRDSQKSQSHLPAVKTSSGLKI